MHLSTPLTIQLLYCGESTGEFLKEIPLSRWKNKQLVFLRHESSSASTNWTEFPGQPEITKKNFRISFGSCVICGLHCILFLYLCVLESWFNCLLLNRRKPLRLKQAEIRIKLQFQLECHLAWKKARVPNLSNGFVKCYKSQCLFTFSEYKQRYIRLFIEQNRDQTASTKASWTGRI